MVMITSDKCYENVEWIYGYRENDTLGGKDPYSASKACAEIAISAYYRSFLNDYPHIKIASARAGNVIGGGDWSKDRLVPDCFKAWSRNQKVTIRSPKATRPWQHVLEPLSGYMLLAQNLYQGAIQNYESFNFGPNAVQDHTVLEVLHELSSHMKLDFEPLEIIENKQLKEAGLLKLNCDKALSYLKWLPTLNYKDTMDFTGTWYHSYFSKEDVISKTNEQILSYQKMAFEKNQVWTN
jgi:CDP-glucose 4,6-dehydratase